MSRPTLVESFLRGQQDERRRLPRPRGSERPLLHRLRSSRACWRCGRTCPRTRCRTTFAPSATARRSTSSTRPAWPAPGRPCRRSAAAQARPRPRARPRADGGILPGAEDTAYTLLPGGGRAARTSASRCRPRRTCCAALEGLRAADGGYANQRGRGAGPDARHRGGGGAAAGRSAPSPIRPPRIGCWPAPTATAASSPLPGAPMPDLLSTATALHALAGLHADLAPIKEPCLDFLDTLWSSRGGFLRPLGRRRGGLRVHLLRPAGPRAPEPLSSSDQDAAAATRAMLARRLLAARERGGPLGGRAVRQRALHGDRRRRVGAGRRARRSGGRRPSLAVARIATPTAAGATPCAARATWPPPRSAWGAFGLARPGQRRRAPRGSGRRRLAGADGGRAGHRVAGPRAGRTLRRGPHVLRAHPDLPHRLRAGWGRRPGVRWPSFPSSWRSSPRVSWARCACRW